MAFSAADLATIEQAIKNAEIRFRHNDRDVTLADIASLKARRSLILSDLAEQSGTKKQRAWKLYSKGRGIG